MTEHPESRSPVLSALRELQHYHRRYQRRATKLFCEPAEYRNLRMVGYEYMTTDPDGSCRIDGALVVAKPGMVGFFASGD